MINGQESMLFSVEVIMKRLFFIFEDCSAGTIDVAQEYQICYIDFLNDELMCRDLGCKCQPDTARHMHISLIT